MTLRMTGTVSCRRSTLFLREPGESAGRATGACGHASGDVCEGRGVSAERGSVHWRHWTRILGKRCSLFQDSSALLGGIGEGTQVLSPVCSRDLPGTLRDASSVVEQCRSSLPRASAGSGGPDGAARESLGRLLRELPGSVRSLGGFRGVPGRPLRSGQTLVPWPPEGMVVGAEAPAGASRVS